VTENHIPHQYLHIREVLTLFQQIGMQQIDLAGFCVLRTILVRLALCSQTKAKQAQDTHEKYLAPIHISFIIYSFMHFIVSPNPDT
jgi:hypothetical protein